MTEIDTLKGRRLSWAVAESQGWTKYRSKLTGDLWWTDDHGQCMEAVQNYQPHFDVAQAWELVERSLIHI